MDQLIHQETPALGVAQDGTILATHAIGGQALTCEETAARMDEPVTASVTSTARNGWLSFYQQPL